MTAVAPAFRLPSNEDHERISALFLGPKAENYELLRTCFDIIVGEQREARLSYFPQDLPSITASIQASEAYNSMTKRITDKLQELLEGLRRFSIPFYSPRYSAHMSVDQTLPAIVGYLSTMFYNPNNVAFEASPFTTLIELEVGRELCDMLGYNTTKDIGRLVAWGHIACDGSVANLESVWAARNLKFYPLSLRDAMRDKAPLAFIADSFAVTTCIGQEKLLKDCDTWELLNLRPATILEIPERLYKEYRISSTFLDNVMKNYTVQSISKDALMKRWGIETQPVLFVPSTKHYSWPKGAAITGIGSDNAVDVPIDRYARLNTTILKEKLLQCLAEKRAVYEVVAVIGTTEEGAVDRFEEMVAIRDTLQAEGLSFFLHADAAWGGYFASMLPPEVDDRERLPAPAEPFVPHVGLRADTEVQLRQLKFADSITIDPHKAGYVPYPAGALCYQDERMRYLLTWTAPYLHQGSEGESIGVYGVEGSKPGASPVSVYLAHQVIGLNPDGYGALLGEASFTCRRFSSYWAAMSDKNTDFIVVPFNFLPSELKEGATPDTVEAEKEYIRKNILPKENQQLVDDPEAMALLNQLGSDLNINAFACNFRYRDGTINTDVEEANWLNRRIFERLSVTEVGEDPLQIPFYLTSTVFAQKDYGECADVFKKRLGLEGKQDLVVLRNVVMSPFTTSQDFIAQLANIFRTVLEEEVENVRKRNEAKAGIHTFLMQGTDKLYFVHLPSFQMASGRLQIIFSADISAPLEKYRTAKRNSQAVAFLRNIEPLLLDEIVDGASFGAEITLGDSDEKISVEVTNIRITKKRSLMAEDFDSAYPSLMPFYLYGTSARVHIDHMLLLAPNIQLSAGNLEYSFKDSLSSEDLEKGVIVVANNVHEQAMQPFPDMEHLDIDDDFFFSAGKKLEVTVYEDPFPSSTMDPIELSKVTRELTTGTLTLVGDIYVDTDKLNASNETSTAVPLARTSDGSMKRTTRDDWINVVSAFHAELSK